ncbi:hypothetical protein [Vibrio chagasii]|uniref:hypothetical protein n=1 Tax=Vibrio chagasii TaxID=170679 RepID=UPI003AF21534
MEQIIGIDLAKRVFQVNIVSAQGEKKANKMITREKLTAFIVQQPPSRIVMEACGSANYWSRQFRQYGHELKQISPQYVAPFRMAGILPAIWGWFRRSTAVVVKSDYSG